MNFCARIENVVLEINACCDGGKFNMLEFLDDKRGGSLAMIHGSKLVAWE